MAKQVVDPEAEVANAPQSVAASVDRLLEKSAGRLQAEWQASYLSITPHPAVAGLWTAEAWLANGAYVSLLGHSEEDAQVRLAEALRRLAGTR